MKFRKSTTTAALKNVRSLTAKVWRDKVDQHNTGTPAYEHIERIIVERASAQERLLPPPDEITIEAEPEFEDRPAVHPGRHWSE